MADFSRRLAENTPGRFYVDDQCLDCDLCRAVAPDHFKRNDTNGTSYVYRQPTTEKELKNCQEAVEGCCVECIGDDGASGDWSKKTHADI